MKNLPEDLCADLLEFDNITNTMFGDGLSEENMNHVLEFINTEDGYAWKVDKEALSKAISEGDCYEPANYNNYDDSVATKTASVDDVDKIIEIFTDHDMWSEDINHIMDYVHMTEEARMNYSI